MMNIKLYYNLCVIFFFIAMAAFFSLILGMGAYVGEAGIITIIILAVVSSFVSIMFGRECLGGSLLGMW